MTAIQKNPATRTTHSSGHSVPEHLSTAKPADTREEKIDRQMEDSFPASDPPSYSGGNHIIGAPVERESEASTPDKPEAAKAEKKTHDAETKESKAH
jgi:hypothetical protein